MSDLNKQYNHFEETHLPSQIAYYLRTILHITQSGSHRSDIDKYVRSVQTSYLLKSTLFQLMDLLVWFKMYVDSNPKTNNWEKIGISTYSPTIKKEHFTKVKWLFGKVISISDNNEAVFQAIISFDEYPISSNLVEKHNLKSGESVKVKVVPSESGKERYIGDVVREM